LCRGLYKSDRISTDGVESLQIEKLLLRRGVQYLSCTEGCLTSESVDDEFMSFIRVPFINRYHTEDGEEDHEQDPGSEAKV